MPWLASCVTVWTTRTAPGAPGAKHWTARSPMRTRRTCGGGSRELPGEPTLEARRRNRSRVKSRRRDVGSRSRELGAHQAASFPRARLVRVDRSGYGTPLRGPRASRSAISSGWMRTTDGTDSRATVSLRVPGVTASSDSTLCSLLAWLGAGPFKSEGESADREKEGDRMFPR
jgi:hypothetical protein